MRQRVWLSSVRDAVERCEVVFFRDAIVAMPEKYVQGKRFLDLLRDVHIEHVRMDGRINHDSDEGDKKGDACWDVKGLHVWQV